MNTVKLPRASWEIVLDYIESDNNPIVHAIFQEISDQIYRQEY